MTTVVGNDKLSHFDVLVIGSGAGGGSVANVLTANGLDVLVLEAGPNHFLGLDDATKQPTNVFSNDELKFQNRSFIEPNPLVEPRTFRHKASDGVRTFTGDVNGLPKHVGGGAAHADLKTPRFMAQDFHLGMLADTFKGTSFADWPIDYDALEPFYAYVEKILGVQGQVGSDPFAEARSTDYPMPPGLPMYLALRLAEGAKGLGYSPFPYPTAVNSRPYDGRPACVDCGFCSGYGCPSNAKGSPPVTTLRRALLSGHGQLRSETRVARLLMNGKKSAVTGVEVIGPDGKKSTLTADRYVLAASPIEDARLMFLSDPGGDGVGNASGQVGRNLMFHLQNIAIGIFDERLHGHRGRTVTHGISDFRGKPNDPDHPLGGIVEIGSGQFPISEAANYVQLLTLLGGFDGKKLRLLLRESPLRDRIGVLTMQAEDAPQASNRVDLDPAVKDLDGLPASRITYENHAFELGARDFYGPKLVEILGASGARAAFLAPQDDISTSAHVMGTLRFGADPKTSVCDASGRFHDVGNLYAADGSLFPTSSGFNPTLTLIALAARVAGEMAFPGSPEKALK